MSHTPAPKSAREGTSTVEPRRVTLGPEDAREVIMRDGVTEGDRVVVGGLFAGGGGAPFKLTA